VEAAKAFIETLYQHAPGWYGALMQFGPSTSEGFLVTNNLSGYTREPSVLQATAEELSSQGGTPLWDSLSEVLDSMEGEAQLRFGKPGSAGRQLLVISDGEDTDSSTRLEAVVEKARRLGIAINAVGFGAQDGLTGPIMSSRAIADLRRVARQTGGFCTIIQADALPGAFEEIARATIAGYVEVQLGFHGKPVSRTGVEGTLHAKDEGELRFFVPRPFTY
jgi:von Willebrand factor type A domain